MRNCSILAFILVFLGGSIGFQDDSDRDFIFAELIHRDSSMSPFYNSSKTASEVLREAITRSLNRINSFNSSLHFGGKDVVSMMIPNEVDYLMKINTKINVGSSQTFLLMASTGSDFTWIYGKPYDDTYHKVDVALFDPYSSDGYEEIPHNSRECRDLPNTTPGKSIMEPESDVPMCEYTHSYREEKVDTRGILSRGKFHFDSTVVPFSLLFGCCHQSYKSTFNSRIQGMAGLGQGESSLISQLANNLNIEKRFSYCLLPLGTDNPSKLIFGKKLVEFSGGRVSIPFKTIIGSPYYFLTLKRVSVLLLAKETKETQTLQTKDNIIIDCGTLITSLDPTIFEEVKLFVRNSLDITPLKEDPDNPFKLCYRKGDVTKANRFPHIKLDFDGEGRSITLKSKNIFINHDDEMICMMIVASTGELSVLGNLAQVGFEIEYNLEANQISFAPANDCREFGI